jgi:F0F1-type ATP synthase assembly protein I
VLTVALPEARRLASGVVAGQAVVTLVVALACYGIAGSAAAVSAAIGGGISTFATLVLVLLAFRGAAAGDPGRAARAFFTGEAAKVVVMITLFVVVLKFVNVTAGALFAGFVATFFVYWIALANALPAFPGSTSGPVAGAAGPGGGDVAGRRS